MNMQQVGALRDGILVFTDEKSHVHTEYLNIFKLIEQICEHVTSGPESLNYTHDFGAVIGESICVETSKDDEVLYATRQDRDGATRFVKGVRPRATTKATIALKRDLTSIVPRYLLVTVYLGEEAPPEPWDESANKNSLIFWSTHALVWGSVPVLPNSETTTCPW
jgi:hypothetical protein